MKVKFTKETVTNVTPKGICETTVYADCEGPIKCVKCENLIPNDNLMYFCHNSKKFFCWGCFIDNPFICHNFAVYRDHQDLLVRVRVKA